jgi:hypothetical protein
VRLDNVDHRPWAVRDAGRVEDVLQYCEEKYPNDDRPRKALEAGRTWVRSVKSGTREETCEFDGESGLTPDSPAGSVSILGQGCRIGRSRRRPPGVARAS